MEGLEDGDLISLMFIVFLGGYYRTISPALYISIAIIVVAMVVATQALWGGVVTQGVIVLLITLAFARMFRNFPLIPEFRDTFFVPFIDLVGCAVIAVFLAPLGFLLGLAIHVFGQVMEIPVGPPLDGGLFWGVHGAVGGALGGVLGYLARVYLGRRNHSGQAAEP